MRWKKRKKRQKKRRRKKEGEKEDMKNKTNQNYKTQKPTRLVLYRTDLYTVTWKISNKKMLSHHSDDKIQTVF